MAELSTQNTLDRQTYQFYQHAITALQSAQVPFLVGGTFAFEYYTGIVRETKDLDLFVRPEDTERCLLVLAETGYQTELAIPHWLGKVSSDAQFIDIIFSSDNGIGMVDDEWFTYAVEQTILDMPILLCPREEMIWDKAFIMERERYDGADVAHLLRTATAHLDWSRLLRRFNSHWRVLFCHLTLFGFIYPDERTTIPDWVMHDMIGQLWHEQWNPPNAQHLCRGTLLSQTQYAPDLVDWSYRDARDDPFE
jgi:hypothetical protein